VVKLECLSHKSAAKTLQHYLSTNQKAGWAGKGNMGVRVPYNKHACVTKHANQEVSHFQEIVF